MATIKSTIDVQAWHEGGDSFGATNGLGTADANGLNFLTNGIQHCHITEPEGNFIVGTFVTSATPTQKIRCLDSTAARGKITMQNTDGGPISGGTAAFEAAVNDGGPVTSSFFEAFNSFHAGNPSELHVTTALANGMQLITTTASEIKFSTNFVQRMVLTALGKVGINNTIPGSFLTLNGSMALATAIQNGGTVTLNDTHYFMAADCTTSDVLVRLPSLALVETRNRTYVVKRVDASANTVTVNAFLGQFIDGAASRSLVSQYDSITIIARSNTEWAII